MWKCRRFRDREWIGLGGTRCPKLWFHAECSNHLSYQGQTFAVPCFEFCLWWYSYFCTKFKIWNINSNSIHFRLTTEFVAYSSHSPSMTSVSHENYCTILLICKPVLDKTLYIYNLISKHSYVITYKFEWASYVARLPKPTPNLFKELRYTVKLEGRQWDKKNHTLETYGQNEKEYGVRIFIK